MMISRMSSVFHRRGRLLTSLRCATQVNARRSVLQLAAVTFNHTTNSLECDRDDTVSPRLLPPPSTHGGGTRVRHAGAAVQSVASGEAMVIALAELNRWHGGWFRRTRPAGPRNYGIQYAYRLGAAFYREAASPSPAACVALYVCGTMCVCGSACVFVSGIDVSCIVEL